MVNVTVRHYMYIQVQNFQGQNHFIANANSVHRSHINKTVLCSQFKRMSVTGEA